MNFRRPKYKFTYGPKTFDILFIAILVTTIWVGSVFEMHDLGFRGDFFSKFFSSTALIYLAWLFIVSRKSYGLEIDETGIVIPSTWLPGVVKHRFSWNDMVDVAYGHKNGLETICVTFKNNKKFHIYTKALTAYYHNKPVRNPSEELVVYIINLLEDRNKNA